MGWHWHQLDHTQIICTTLQTDNHASTPLLSFFTGRMLFLMPNQQCQSSALTVTTHHSILFCVVACIAQCVLHDMLFDCDEVCLYWQDPVMAASSLPQVTFAMWTESSVVTC